MNKVKLSLIFSLLVLFLLFGCTQAVLDNSAEYIEPVYVTLKVVDVSKETVFYDEVEVQPGTNAFEVMKNTFGTSLKYKEYDFGVFIEEINNIKPDSDSFFKLYINGQEANAGITTYNIIENTIIEWKVENFSDFN